jgi:predicted nucleotidyltransferase
MFDLPSLNPHLVLSVGTQVVSLKEVRGADGAILHPKGAVGVIVKAPVDNRHAYMVRFLDGFELAIKRKEFAIRKQYQRAGFESRAAALDEYNLLGCVIYRCVVGSRAFGLAGDNSDTDRRGIFLPPAELQWSLFGVPEQIEIPETEECYWELQKFLALALKANPNILECLYTPMVEEAKPLALELLNMRSAFLSKLVYQTYNGYVASQFKKLGQSLRNKGSIKWKHAMHLIRLLLSGITVLREGLVPVRIDEHRVRLLAIRDGTVKWDEVNRWRLTLHKEFDAAFATTRLPDQPDYERTNAFLVRARRAMVEEGAR